MILLRRKTPHCHKIDVIFGGSLYPLLAVSAGAVDEIAVLIHGIFQTGSHTRHVERIGAESKFVVSVRRGEVFAVDLHRAFGAGNYFVKERIQRQQRLQCGGTLAAIGLGAALGFVVEVAVKVVVLPDHPPCALALYKRQRLGHTVARKVDHRVKTGMTETAGVIAPVGAVGQQFPIHFLTCHAVLNDFLMQEKLPHGKGNLTAAAECAHLVIDFHDARHAAFVIHNQQRDVIFIVVDQIQQRQKRGGHAVHGKAAAVDEQFFLLGFGNPPHHAAGGFVAVEHRVDDALRSAAVVKFASPRLHFVVAVGKAFPQMRCVVDPIRDIAHISGIGTRQLIQPKVNAPLLHIFRRVGYVK